MSDRRMKTPHRCVQCGGTFYPNTGTQRLYCGMPCVHASASELAAIARRLRDARVPQPLPREEWPEVVA